MGGYDVLAGGQPTRTGCGGGGGGVDGDEDERQ